ncbi:ATP synthase subunit I [Mannheimia glucosida]|uniref:ATP synthase subunit I n=1 Tax=Mannheimia glucosida TaxID=85401 RepID=UPI0033102060|nr:ATP synthase subunit I [Mannheimia haemolytica]
MSAVINKAKSQYKQALKTEFFILCLLVVGLSCWKMNLDFSFLGGALASFLPHLVFVYWIFFKKSAKNQSKMTAFYRGEGMKWLVTIILVIGCFKLIPNLDFVWFFVGYFIALFLNNMIPFVLSKHHR